ncbi:hypothetical protein Rhe02_49390 [Rhizocola hellebori]|uniref:Uncharacterized protein n=1 Tax=Rhizocola hellebori TaxID=1392758 RepID=A0A8J3QBL0_9ACTN|nr:hypothetical protein [Rhizocola hellebori]GIH06872.1 hypothetical protein Rhe02_49390 [Rhizocola hellebori]
MADPTPHASFSPTAVKVDLGRASIVAVLLTIVLFGLFSAGGVYAALDTEETMVTVIGLFFATIFGFIALFGLLALPRAFQPRVFVFDADGIHHFQGTDWTLMPWQDVAAVGIGYDQPPEAPSLPLSIEDAVKGFVVDKAKSAMNLDSKRRFGLEIYPASPEVLSRYPILTRYRKQLHVPAAGLAANRWRFPLPPVLGTVSKVERAVQTHRSDLWLGWYARPWRRGFPM